MNIWLLWLWIAVNHGIHFASKSRPQGRTEKLYTYVCTYQSLAQRSHTCTVLAIQLMATFNTSTFLSNSEGLFSGLPPIIVPITQIIGSNYQCQNIALCAGKGSIWMHFGDTSREFKWKSKSHIEYEWESWALYKHENL